MKSQKTDYCPREVAGASHGSTCMSSLIRQVVLVITTTFSVKHLQLVGSSLLIVIDRFRPLRLPLGLSLYSAVSGDVGKLVEEGGVDSEPSLV